MNRNTNERPFLFEALLALALGLLILALTSCGVAARSSTGDAPAEEKGAEGGSSSHAGNFAGKVEDTEAFVALVVDEQNRVLAYLCDGRGGGEGQEPFEWSVTEWFRGQASDDGAIDLTSEGGARLVANVPSGGEGAEGTVTLPDGEEFSFEAEPAEEPAGLYRKVQEVEGEELVGGWIVLSNGEERGAVKNRSSGFKGGTIDLARPSRPVNGFVGSDIDF